MADHFIPPQGRRTIRQRHGLPDPGISVSGVMAPTTSRANRDIRMWHLGDGAPGSTIARLRQAYLGALDAVDRVGERKAEALKSGKFTEAGATDHVSEFIFKELSPTFKRGRNVIDKAKAEAKALREKIRLEAADKGDLVGALQRREMREFLRTMPDKQRNEYVSKRRDNMDPALALAICELPAEFSGVLETDRNDLIDRALQAQHGEAMTQLRELEEAIEIAESAVETGRDEVRTETGLNPQTFDHRAAQFENKSETPWLKRMTENGQEVVRVIRWAKDGSTGTGALPTAQDLETGKFFKDRAEYDAANREWLKHRDAEA
jgi:hypothetical protein